jgi:hypothetical protein
MEKMTIAGLFLLLALAYLLAFHPSILGPLGWILAFCAAILGAANFAARLGEERQRAEAEAAAREQLEDDAAGREGWGRSQRGAGQNIDWDWQDFTEKPYIEWDGKKKSDEERS